MRKQESEFGLNERGMDKFNLDIEIVKITINPYPANVENMVSS